MKPLQSIPKEDTYQHKGKRRQLIQLLREKGIKDEKVLEAMDRLPRHFFLNSSFEHHAYEDKAFPIVAGQTISQPYTVAFQSQVLQIQKFDKVLEVGSGSLYQACVLAEMGAKVFTIERQKELHDFVGAYFFLSKYPQVRRFYGDGYEGLPSYGPFDKIIITAAAPFIPPRLIEQLKPGGIMVVPVGGDDGQKMLRITKDEAGIITQQDLGDFSFVPMLGGTNR